MNSIKVFPCDSKEYKRLELASSIIFNETGFYGWIEKTYFDYGQDWSWTTIILHKNCNNSYQLLNPAEHEKIVYGNYHEFLSTVESVINRISERGY